MNHEREDRIEPDGRCEALVHCIEVLWVARDEYREAFAYCGPLVDSLLQAWTGPSRTNPEVARDGQTS